MRFRYVTEKLNLNGSTESSATDFPFSELTIGRGGSSDLILSNRSVSLVHAKLGWNGTRLLVEDQQSLAGLRVNGKRTARSELGEGDIIQLGDVKLTVRAISGAEITLVQQINMATHVSDEQVVAKQLAALGLKKYLPSIRLLSLFLLFLVAMFFLYMPMIGADKGTWSSGPISNHHKMIEGDCVSCHTKPFEKVQDVACLKCHNLTDHSKALPELVAHRPDLNKRCGDCHMEHNGDTGLTVRSPQLCVNCHGSLKGVKQDTAFLDIPDFTRHPQFRVDVKVFSFVARVSLDDKSSLIDSTHIKLNHSLHLSAGLRGKDGPTTLHCNSCHELNADFKTIKPISFDNNCRSCHPLGFDQRLSNVQVPHGDDEAIYPALFTEYTKLLLLGEKQKQAAAPAPAEYQRSIPGGTGVPAAQPETVNATLVAKSAREAEKQLFTKTACYVCHDATEKPAAEQRDTNSHYKVVKPNIPNVWFKKANFDHGAHEEVSCESCHEATRNSSKTSDVLLPKIETCRECHAEGDKQGYVKSDCIMCHSYHDPLSFPREKKKSIASYLSLIKR